MPIIVLVAALVAFVYAMAAYPQFRKPGAAIAAVVAIGLGTYFYLSDPDGTRATERLQPDDLILTGLELEPTLRGQTLRGRVENPSETARLRDFTVVVNLYDCPEEDSDFADCATIAEGQGIARADVPPGQVRGFAVPMVFANMPEVEGTLRWRHRITGLRASE